MEMVSFDFTTVLWEYVCQLSLFPLSDVNARAQITRLVEVNRVCDSVFSFLSRWCDVGLLYGQTLSAPISDWTSVGRISMLDSHVTLVCTE